MRVLALNVGSSTLKASLFDVDATCGTTVEACAPSWECETTNAEGTVEGLLKALEGDARHLMRRDRPVDVVGHRIVHGGATLTEATQITPAVRSAIEAVAEIAPMHNAPALAGIDAIRRLLGSDVPHVAVFDTAFHATLPAAASTYAGPFEWAAQGIRRYGFHGLSHHYASRRATSMLGSIGHPPRIVSCHLGSGCSVAAVKDGRSVDITMGFTPLDGVPMATRSGSIDPGILIHLLRHREHTVDSLERILNHKSGLAGLSGTNGDMRDVITAMNAGRERARLAFDVYVLRVRGAIAAMAASMGGLDALVFTGGVGEHSPQVRTAVCEGLEFMGVALEESLNTAIASDGGIARQSSGVAVLVIKARENWVIAQECHHVMSGSLSNIAAH